MYIEFNNKKILFDIGPNNRYIKNAKKLNVDLSDVDYLVISHGHYDHGSGISKFLKLNSKAYVILSVHAFEEHGKLLSTESIKNIGIKKPLSNKRLKFIEDDTILDEGIKLITNVTYQKQVIDDSSLVAYKNGRYREDEFDHEIYMLLEDENNRALFSGCSHKGIKNIVESIELNEKMELTHVFGGYHLYHYDPFDFTQNDYLQQLGSELKKKKAEFYSCHCTGNDAFFELKKEMKEKIIRLKSGSIINI